MNPTYNKMKEQLKKIKMCIDVMNNETPRLKKDINGDFGNAYQYVIWLEATLNDIEKALKQ